jgi:hypothetical protein
MCSYILITRQAIEDLKRLRALENDPRFLARIAQARASYRAGQGVRLEDAALDEETQSEEGVR